MPGNHGEISLNEQNGVDNDNKKTTTRKKKKKKKDVITADDDDGDDSRNSTNQLVMPSISKARKRFVAKIIRKKPKSPKRCSSPHSSSRSGSVSRKGSCFRLMRPRRKDKDDSCASSPTSDPNDESFSHEMLRAMLETNDFCSNECNPHR